MSRSPLRGAALAAAPVELRLRPPAPRPPTPGTPEEARAAAEREAGAIVAAARAEREAVLAAAREEGLAAGLEEARAELADALSALSALAGDLEAHRRRLEDDAAAEATVLAIEVASRIVRAEVHARPERVEEVLRGAIRRAADRSALVAMVHPADLSACRAAAPGILESMGGIARLDVVDDPRVGRGSCVLQTTGGDVDATFESQLARVLEGLTAPPDELLVEP
ncbi:FliH/SctL family protein [Miltoncostaea marina]|uniref:FliH/SctL family protein n=1 Tax=Miltoncostaea marina TaxID=2843215 RepID=UPI001C3C4C31|nr:FliH/SctL family protein [Miltoncostaea marina]